MNTDIIVVDNFYNNPDQVRDVALSSDFSVLGNYPGRRTASYLNDSTKEVLQNLVRQSSGGVIFWGEEIYTGSFQFTTKHDESWIHVDQHNTWAAVCYLTPDAPHTAGTGLFMHKETGVFKKPEDEALQEQLSAEGNDLSKWYLTDVVSNKFNRLALYRGDMYHRSLDYFGEDKFTGRLFQTFFFSTEY